MGSQFCRVMFGIEDDPKRAPGVTALRARPLSGVNQGVGLFCKSGAT